MNAAGGSGHGSRSARLDTASAAAATTNSTVIVEWLKWSWMWSIRALNCSLPFSVGYFRARPRRRLERR